MPKRRMAKIRAWLSLTLFLLIGAMGWRSCYALDIVRLNVFGDSYHVGYMDGEIIVGHHLNPRAKRPFEFESSGFQPEEATALWNEFHLRAGFGYYRISGESNAFISCWALLALAMLLAMWQWYLLKKSTVSAGGFEVVYPEKDTPLRQT